MSLIVARQGAQIARPWPAEPARPWRQLTIHDDPGAIEDDWRRLEASGLVTPYQSFGWVSSFVATVGKAQGESFGYARLADAGGAPLAILPLGIQRRGFCRVAEFIGGKHANYHMPLLDRDFAARLDPAQAMAALAEIAAGMGGLDAFAFIHQPLAWDSVANPFARLAPSPSPSAAYKLALTPGDCEGTLRRALSAHAHKKLKNKRNRFAAFGESRVTRAGTSEEAGRILDAFLRQKAVRFAQMGIEDPFAEAGMRDFLERAALPRDGRPASVVLYSLDVAGESVATYVGAVHGRRFSGMATSFDIGSEIAKTSPGEILLVELIKRKCRDGFTMFDLGVGEARYKTTICDDKDDLVDSHLPLTAKGRILALAGRLKQQAKRRIKTSPLAMRLVRLTMAPLRGRRG